MIFDLINDRRSVFPEHYNDQPLERATVKKILEAANRAPTHKNTEPWRFKVLMGAKKEALGKFLSKKYQETDPKPKQFKIKKLQENPKRSAAIIAICMQRDPLQRLPEWEELAATAMAVQNMWLCCTALHIGCYWSSPAIASYMDEFFTLKEGEKCLGFLYMGYYDHPVATSTRTPIEEKVAWLD